MSYQPIIILRFPIVIVLDQSDEDEGIDVMNEISLSRSCFVGLFSHLSQLPIVVESIPIKAANFF